MGDRPSPNTRCANRRCGKQIAGRTSMVIVRQDGDSRARWFYCTERCRVIHVARMNLGMD